MLGYVFRRLVWSIPTLFGISLLAFVLTSILPVVGYGQDNTRTAVGEDQRRKLFLDLPRFINTNPLDARARSLRAAHQIATDDAPSARTEISRVGGAGLPHVIPYLDQLTLAERVRVASALVPIALRSDPSLHLPQEANELPGFWARYWDDHILDFTPVAIERAVKRYTTYEGEERRRAILAVDTYALDAIFRVLYETVDPLARARLLALCGDITGLAPHVSEHDDTTTVELAAGIWREWWYVHRSDFITYSGTDRAIVVVSETRYGKWVSRVFSGELGVSSRDGEAIATKLARYAPVTLSAIGLALLLSYLLAVPLGLLTAYRKGERVDFVSAGVLFAMYSVPIFVYCEFLRHVFAGSLLVHSGVLLSAFAMAIAMTALLSRYQRASVLDVLRQDYVRTAVAKGASPWRVLVVHVLRNAVIPTISVIGTQFPSLLGSAFVVEEIFRVHGLGYETLRAVEAHDVPWLVAIVTVTALITTLALLVSDIAAAILNPRLKARAIWARWGRV